MTDVERVPYERADQSAVVRQWEAVADGGVAAASTRAVVRDSWQRSVRAAVPADLPRAPLVLSDDALASRRAGADWVPFALRAAGMLQGAFASGHVLSLFDAQGRMLACDGDPAALDGLAAINFRPGGLWAESAVGTNGPGTALASGRAVHIVGAEHFCEAWHGWHCAAVPLHDEVTGEVLGVLDISGFRRFAHPHTLELATALATSVQQSLAMRDAERRYAVLHRFGELASTYAGDALVAVDRGGRVLHATPATPAGLRPGTATPEVLRAAMAAHVRAIGRRDATTDASGDGTGEVLLDLTDDVGVSAVSYPVLDAGTAVGACFLLRGGARSLSPRRASVSASSSGTAAARAVAPPARRRGVTRYDFESIAGRSPRLAAARRVAAAAATNALPVLIVGESGTGKEVFAQAIHDGGARRLRPFVAVNCAALPRELVEAELFGYVGGAFTGARSEGSAGKFRAAEGGTIFLDEIAELPPAAQAALLRVLQEREVTPVGSSASRALDVRVIAATNRDLAAALASGALRADLYYRLNVLPIELPPLRARADDVPALARRFLDAAAEELGRPGLAFDAGVLDALARHAWPGNVRELENLVRRLASLCDGGLVTLLDLPPALRTSAADASAGAVTDALVDTADRPDPERGATLQALVAARTMADAAARLGIDRSTLYRRLARYGIKPERTLRPH